MLVSEERFGGYGVVYVQLQYVSPFNFSKLI